MTEAKDQDRMPIHVELLTEAYLLLESIQNDMRNEVSPKRFLCTASRIDDFLQPAQTYLAGVDVSDPIPAAITENNMVREIASLKKQLKAAVEWRDRFHGICVKNGLWANTTFSKDPNGGRRQG